MDLTKENFEQIVHNSIFTDISIEELAAKCNRSLTSFKKEFRKHFFEPPHKWFIRQRLMHSRLLLICLLYTSEYRRRVVDYMFAEYGRGRTPNPDVLCNREIKFDAFLQAALKLGADYVATGHYCRREVTETDEGPVYRLLAGSDPNKDQSLSLIHI